MHSQTHSHKDMSSVFEVECVLSQVGLVVVKVIHITEVLVSSSTCLHVEVSLSTDVNAIRGRKWKQQFVEVSVDTIKYVMFI